MACSQGAAIEGKKGNDMNVVEKAGLALFIVGICGLDALFVVGGGDAAAAMRNDVAISPIPHLIGTFLGLVVFVGGHAVDSAWRGGKAFRQRDC